MANAVDQECWRKIEELRDQTIRDQTKPIDETEAAQAVRDMWQKLGYETPVVVIARSPGEAVAWARYAVPLVEDELNKQRPAGEEFDAIAYSAVLTEILQANAPNDPREVQNDVALDKMPWQFELWRRVRVAWLRAGEIMGVKYEGDKKEKYELLQRWCDNVIFCCPFDRLVSISRPPLEVHWQDGLLHNDSGPAVLFEDGYKLWSLQNHNVDEQIVMHPETQTIEQIDQEENADIRAIRLERFGWPRYLRESKARVIDRRKCDISNTMEILFETRRGEKRLVVSCPTRRIFALGVPDSITTCNQAQNWLAGETDESLDKPFHILART